MIVGINLMYQVFNQNLVNMATASILVEALLPVALLRYCMVIKKNQMLNLKSDQVDKARVICGHTLCPAAICSGCHKVDLYLCISICAFEFVYLCICIFVFVFLYLYLWAHTLPSCHLFRLP